ncbi:uncharacterized protein PHACADRAFT_48118, partial [Phanerochaete carnosa HHB-10118-sp]
STMSEAASKLQRHPMLYKATGDIVISATDKSILHRFCVHTVVLAKHSPVFADMLTLPMHEVDMQKYDRIPMIYLPENAKDVASLLEVLYTPSSPLFKRSDWAFAKEVYGLMSTVTKYQFDSICTAIVHYLKSEWPTTLAEFVRFKMDIYHDHAFAGPFTSAVWRFPEPASAIRLAMDFNV